MKITYRIAVPKPCSEDWEGMKPLGCGRFCAACEKTVVDFTTFSDEAFIAYFRENEGNTCGRFTQDQLNLEIPWLDIAQAKRPGTKSLYKTLQYAALSLLPMALPEGSASGQRQAAITEQQAASAMYPVTVTGILQDEKGATLPGGSVLLRGSGEGTTTDMDGRFAIQLHDGLDTLEFRSFGSETRLLKIENPGLPLQVRLAGVPGELPEPVFVSGPVLRKGHVSAGSAIIKQPVTDVVKATSGAVPDGQPIWTGGRQLVPSVRMPDRQYKAPLIVLNGKQFKGNITEIDPQQIKAIKLLKDARATALYGVAGRNGVLLVETKNASFWYRIIRPFRRK